VSGLVKFNSHQVRSDKVTPDQAQDKSGQDQLRSDQDKVKLRQCQVMSDKV